MRFPKSFAILSVVVLIALLATSCGPAVLPTDKPEEQGFILALPRITVSYAADGTPSLVGLKLEELAPIIQTYTGQDITAYVSALRLDPFWVSWMTNTDVQHVEIMHGAGGILIFVNGKLMPHLAWSGESLANVVTAVGMFTGQSALTGMITPFLPFIRNTGIGVVLMFPKQEGAAEIPVRAPVAVAEMATAAAMETSMILRAEVLFDDTGVPTLKGFDYSLDEMAQMAGLPGGAIGLPPMLVEQMKMMGIETLELRVRDDGIWIYVNGMEMPHIAWGADVLANTAAMYDQMNPNSPLTETLYFLLPAVGQANIDLIVHFPTA